VTEGFKRYLFKKTRLIPLLRKEIKTQIAAGKETEENLLKLFTDNRNDNPEFNVRLSSQGLTNDEIVSKMEVYINLVINSQICQVTSGGTEFIILAVKAYRDYAVRFRGISNPEILIPVTAHAAFDKADKLLNMRVKHMGMSQATIKVRLDVMESMVTNGTCMLVWSTPTFPHGSIDAIQSIPKLGLKYNIIKHVDVCFRGFLLAFMPKAGFQVPSFDFSVDGVTSISADTHKYGFTPKGSSVFLFNDTKFRHHQYFVQTNWRGGIYATSTLAGSRLGFLLLAAGLHSFTRLRDIYVIFVYGEPQVSVIATGSDDFDSYSLADSLNTKWWSLNNLQFPY
ncbi:unnamed protein product, partial [Allacma fusca]